MPDIRRIALKNVGVLFSDFGPYHVARIQSLTREVDASGGSVTAFRFVEKGVTYGWNPEAPKGIETETLAASMPTDLLSCFRLAIRFYSRLRSKNIQVVFLPSYSPTPNLLCLLAARLARAKTVMMNETWRGTERKGIFTRLVKHCVIRLFHGALVGGRPQAAYAIHYGIRSDNIFLGYDVVDVDYFASETSKWNSKTRDELPVKLPERYFLNLGRFVKKKNLITLVEAYAEATKNKPDVDIALVLVGAGEEELALTDRAASLGLPVIRESMQSGKGARLVIYPFQQIDQTPLYYAFAEAFVLPSRNEEWGLVVNEAMSSRLPVIVSESVGCAQDLILHGQTGYRFDANQSAELAAILTKFINDPSLRNRLGEQAFRHIQNWRAERFGKNGLAVANRVVGVPTQRKKVVFLVESLAVRCGGTSLEVATIATALSEASDYDVIIVTCPDAGPHFHVGPKVRIVSFNGARLGCFWLNALRGLRRVLRDADTVFVTGIWGLFDGLALRYTRPSTAALCIRVCGMLQPYILKRNAWKKRLGLMAWCKYNLSSASALIVNSDLELKQVSDLNFNEKVVCIRNGIVPPADMPLKSTARARYLVKDCDRVLLYLGRVHPKKGLDYFLRAIVAVQKSGQQIPKVVVAGAFSDRDYERTIRELVALLPPNSVTFTGEVEGEQKEQLFALADAFILPSQSEGLPNAVLEAMARKLPVIITSGCNLPEVADQQAGLVVEFQVSDFETAIEWFMASQKLELERLGQNARALVDREFSLTKTIDQYKRLIESAGTTAPVVTQESVN